MGRFFQYLKETRAELKHVSWPTRRQALISSVLVVAISLVVAALLGFFDFVFTELLDIYLS